MIIYMNRMHQAWNESGPWHQLCFRVCEATHGMSGRWGTEGPKFCMEMFDHAWLQWLQYISHPFISCGLHNKWVIFFELMLREGTSISHRKNTREHFLRIWEVSWSFHPRWHRWWTWISYLWPYSLWSKLYEITAGQSHPVNITKKVVYYKL